MPDLRRPTVSVIMPVHDAERYLGAAIDSIRSQTFEDLELIVSLNGITDSSTDIARAAAAEDERVRLLEREEPGLVAALNAGLAAAHGDLIAVLDADDLARPDRIATQVAFLAANPEVGLVGSWAQTIDTEGRPIRLVPMPTRRQGLELLLEHQCLTWHPSIMVRRRAIDAVGGYRSICELAHDFDLYLRLLGAGIAIDTIPRALVDYRVVPSGITQRRGAEQRRDAEIAVGLHRLAALGVEISADQFTATEPASLIGLIPAGRLQGLRLRLSGLDLDGIAALDAEGLDAARARILPVFATSHRDADLALLAYRLAAAERAQRRWSRALGWYRRSRRADPRLFAVLLARTVRAWIDAVRLR
jgi:cellulose synthase/poly-beta-1,6-N-acetylglucosamine synthase-like glycosyltransferase